MRDTHTHTEADAGAFARHYAEDYDYEAPAPSDVMVESSAPGVWPCLVCGVAPGHTPDCELDAAIHGR